MGPKRGTEHSPAGRLGQRLRLHCLVPLRHDFLLAKFLLGEIRHGAGNPGTVVHRLELSPWPGVEQTAYDEPAVTQVGPGDPGDLDEADSPQRLVLCQIPRVP
jgi:hypothetical protein